MTSNNPSQKKSPATAKSPSARTSNSDDARKGKRNPSDGVSQEGASYAQSYAQEAKDTAAVYAESAKDTVAQQGEDVASALRKAADEMRSGSPQERTLGQIADGIADVSEAIRDKDLGQIVGDLNSFARRKPMLFLTGAALVGFAAVRFAKASNMTSGGRAGRNDQRGDVSASSPQTASSPAAGAGVPHPVSQPNTGEPV